MVPQFLRETMRACVEVAAQQQRFHALADWLHPVAKGATRHRAIANLLPEGKQFFGRSHQIVAETFARRTGAVDQSLEIAFQVSPAPLQTAKAPIHAGAIAMDDTVED